MYEPTGVVIMTALVPTKGHQALVQFAVDYLATNAWGGGHLHVIICSRSFEPVSGADRVTAFREQFASVPAGVELAIHEMADDTAPQNPPDHPDFWAWWAQAIFRHTGPISNGSGGFYLFSSEPYGVQLSESVGAEFVPFDVKREIIDIRGTMVRGDMWHQFSNLMPSFQRIIRPTVTIFGAESTGKTTIARAVAARMNGQFVPEWARQYLETVGPKLTLSKMATIAHGQYAAQLSARNLPDRMVTVQDTDLLSTIGYYRIMGQAAPTFLTEAFQRSRADLYLVADGSIPFEPDALRYGGDKRESTDAFWLDLLNEFGCNYRVIGGGTKEYRSLAASSLVMTLLRERLDPIRNFVREIAA